MSETLTYERLALETDETLERLRHWHEIGLVPGEADRFPPEHAECVRLVQFAERRGIAPEQVADVSARQGDLLGVFIETIGTARRTGFSSFEEAAERFGIAPELLQRLRAAAGLSDQARPFEGDIEALEAMTVALRAGFPEDAMLQLVRVFADASGRMAEAVSRLFHLHVHERFRAAGKRGPDLIGESHRVSQSVRGLLEPTLMYFHRKAWERALRDDLLLHLTEEMTEPSAVPGQLVRTVLFADLAGFTPMTEAMGDAAAANVVDRFSEIVREATSLHAGQLIKQIGDEFMLVFPDAASAVACGVAIERAAAMEPNFPAVRSGAHTGSLLYREADYVGATVNLAARVGAAAGPHELLVTDAVRSEAAGLPGVEFRYGGRRELKGLPEPVDVFLAVPTEEPPARVRDPVCGMELDPSAAAARLLWRGTTYWFCSPDCLRRFTAEPERYAAAGDRRSVPEARHAERSS